jgi:hypothetical protein
MNQTVTLPLETWALIENALRLAAEKYKENAAELLKLSGHERLADQFKRQERETLQAVEAIQQQAGV